MKSNSTTKVISYVALGLFLLYEIVDVGTTGFLFSIAIGLIIFSLIDSIEIATAIVILVGLCYKFVLGPKTQKIIKSTTEGFASRRSLSQSSGGAEGFNTDSGEIVSKRVRNIITSNRLPIATYSSPFVEGFADASSATNGQAQGEQNTNATSATSQPAKIEDAPPTVTPPKGDTSQTFQGGIQADGLFKLGELPTEAKGGAHIDQGTTLMNAIGSLKPDQIKSMTDDTRKLLDTQKSLMSMLNTMKPMLNDGKQLMETFQQMFGPNGAGGGPVAAVAVA